MISGNVSCVYGTVVERERERVLLKMFAVEKGEEGILSEEYKLWMTSISALLGNNKKSWTCSINKKNFIRASKRCRLTTNIPR